MKGIFLDTETNGLDWTRHQILEIAFVLIHLGTGEEIDSYASLVQINETDWAKSDPSSLKYTGITWEDTLQGKPITVIQKEITQMFKTHALRKGEAAFICQNPTFDRIFFSHLIATNLQEQMNLPYNWLDLASMHFALQIKHGTNPNDISLSKDGIASYFRLPPEQKPHRALNGVRHLLACYKQAVGFPLENIRS